MAVEVKKMNRRELETLRNRVDRQLEKLKSDDRKKARDAAEKAAKAHGYSLAELTGGERAKAAKPGKRKSGKSGTVGVAKYADPANPSKTWTGKGRQPEWFKAALAAGKSPEQLEIK